MLLQRFVKDRGFLKDRRGGKMRKIQTFPEPELKLGSDDLTAHLSLLGGHHVP